MIENIDDQTKYYERIFFSCGANHQRAKDLASWIVKKFGVIHTLYFKRTFASRFITDQELKLQSEDLNEAKEYIYFRLLIDTCIYNRSWDCATVLRTYRNTHEIEEMQDIEKILSCDTDHIVTEDIAFLLGMSMDDAEKFFLTPIENENFLDESSEWYDKAEEKLNLLEEFCIAMLHRYNDLKEAVEKINKPQ